MILYGMYICLSFSYLLLIIVDMPSVIFLYFIFANFVYFKNVLLSWLERFVILESPFSDLCLTDKNIRPIPHHPLRECFVIRKADSHNLRQKTNLLPYIRSTKVMRRFGKFYNVFPSEQ